MSKNRPQTVDEARSEAPIQRNWREERMERLVAWLEETNDIREEEFKEIETHRGYAIVWYPGATFRWDASSGECQRLA